MDLIRYLNEHFHDKKALLELSKIDEKTLHSLQQMGVMPKCSYKLSLNLQSDSFFGLHQEEQEVEYYAKGYVSWLAIINHLPLKEGAYAVFSNRYKAAIDNLKLLGHSSNNSKLTSELDSHIKQEWQHFLDGIYGLCTKSGLPEDIAAKEFSIIEINELTEFDELDAKQLEKLTLAVNLLDKASSPFAPHERLKSSRHRLVNEVRRKYQLKQ